MIVLGVTGTRQGLSQAQRFAAHRLLVDIGPTRLHHGDCIGVDVQIHVMATKLGIPITVHPPDIRTYRAFTRGDQMTEPLPYLVRDRIIVDTCTLLLAVPNGPEKLRSGTWATVRYARKQHRRIVILRPDGDLEYR